MVKIDIIFGTSLDQILLRDVHDILQTTISLIARPDLCLEVLTVRDNEFGRFILGWGQDIPSSYDAV